MGRSEIDLVVVDGDALVIVEVKTRSSGDPGSRFDERKVDALLRAQARMEPRPDRIDLVTVELGARTASVRWLKGIA